jgi:DNA processing protein
MEELTALLALSRIDKIDNVRKKRLVEGHERIAALFEGKERAENAADDKAIRAFRAFGTIDEDLARLSKMGAVALTIRDSAYPPSLREIPDAPLVLYKKGPLALPHEAFAVVGARKASFEGMLLAERIADTLSLAGITVVSGLARGIDAAAHKGALHGKGGTVGVLGCGIDRCYPMENWPLFQGIAQAGALLTEYRPGEAPMKHHFPERNRIIAGLSKGVLVVEASEKSGSLITARLALDYGREIMAIPGRVFDEAYKGANGLIKEGALLVEDINDILTCCFPGIEIRTKSALDMDGDEDYIYTLLGSERLHVDELIEKSGLEARKVMAVLTRLEMKDIVRLVPGGFYLRKV